MPEALKIIGQAAPAAGVGAALRTVPAGTSVVVSSLTICNTGATDTTVNVHACAAGAAAAVGNAVVYGLTVGAGQTIALTLGLTLAATDVLRVQSAGGAVTFSAFGSEVS